MALEVRDLRDLGFGGDFGAGGGFGSAAPVFGHFCNLRHGEADVRHLGSAATLCLCAGCTSFFNPNNNWLRCL